MKIWYYPGCTLKKGAEALEKSALASLALLGVQAQELPEWNCCGAVHSLADDDLIRHLAPVRMLKRTAGLGGDKLLTICSMCYNTLARANLIMRGQADKRRSINLFLDERDDYEGQVEVVHLLPFLRDEIGWERIARAVKKPLAGLKVGPYYGCTLNRPKEVAIDQKGDQGCLEGLLQALGAQVVPFAETDLCCGSYQGVGYPGRVDKVVERITAGASRAGAGTLALSCPLCEFNLVSSRKRPAREKGGADPLEILFFTQLLARALGLEERA